MLHSIIATSLYKSSSRKDAILATITNPINMELVTQISDYLDDDSYKKLYEAVVEEKQEDASKVNQDTADEVSSDPFTEYDNTHPTPSTESSMGSSTYSPAPESPMGDIPDSDAPVDIPDPDAPTVPTSDVEETTTINKASILGTTDIENDLASNIVSIRDTLNAKSDTCGVCRLEITDSELWIYYNDEINLNDVMVDVIESLNSMGFTELKFSRLARSNNAVVFDINHTLEDMESIVSVVEE